MFLAALDDYYNSGDGNDGNSGNGGDGNDGNGGNGIGGNKCCNCKCAKLAVCLAAFDDFYNSGDSHDGHDNGGKKRCVYKLCYCLIFTSFVFTYQNWIDKSDNFHDKCCVNYYSEET